MPLDMLPPTRPQLNPLRPIQQRAIDGLRQSLASGNRRPVLQGPTGFGKTVVASHIVTGARAKGKRVAFCVPSISLIDQTFTRFAENGIDPVEMGVLQGDHPWRRTHAPIQICSAQTLARRELPAVDFAVIDECHLRHEIYERWMTSRPEMIFVGLSATPWSKGLGKFYDDLIKPTSLSELIAEGWLSKFRVFAPSHPDLEGVRTIAGDYHEGMLAERMDKPQLVADIVSTWLAKAEGRPTLCFAVNRLHAQHLHEQFAANGVAAAYVDANTPREEREQIGRDLAAGRIQVVCNIGCLTTGIDWDVRCIILARPTKSEMLFVQIIGRGLRTANGKADCLLLDHSDTHLKLGFVTDIDHDYLDDGSSKRGKAAAKEAEDKQPLPRECKSCAALVPATMKACPHCGAEIRRPSGVETVDGELVEMSSAIKRGVKGPPLIDQVRALPRQAVWSRLLGYCDEKGKGRNYALANYKAIFDGWPRGLVDQPIECDGVLRAYIRHKALRWSKVQAKIGKQEGGHAF